MFLGYTQNEQLLHQATKPVTDICIKMDNVISFWFYYEDDDDDDDDDNDIYTIGNQCKYDKIIYFQIFTLFINTFVQ